MDEPNNPGDESRRRILASPTRLLVFAVLLPAAVAIVNQGMFATAARRDARVVFAWMGESIAARNAQIVYASMAASIAVLSWCTGRYLSPAWLRWIVFAWSLALLDLLTIAACLSGPLPNDFAFLLVSAQVSLLALWTILAPVDWQWRLPGTVVGAALLIVYASNWYGGEWGVLLLFSSVVVALVCGALRWFGFALQCALDESEASRADTRLAQFGIKHLLIWATALPPLLLAARGLDFVMFARLDAQSIFPTTLLSLSLATVSLVAIWAVLGSGAGLLRIALLLLVPLSLGIGLRFYAASYRPATLPWLWPDSPVLSLLIHMEEEWPAWISLNAMLLAALLLFLRASGYRLVRKRA